MNGFEYTKSCVLSLLNCHYENYKIILVDNNSSDLSVEKLKKEFPQVKYIRNKSNIGFTGANNVGIKWALEKDFEYIALLNNDTEVEPDFLDHLLTPFEQDSLVGAVQPLILQYNRRNIIWNGGGQIDFTFGRFLNINKGSVTEDEKFSLTEVECLGACVNAPVVNCLLYTSPSPRDLSTSRMPSSA